MIACTYIAATTNMFESTCDHIDIEDMEMSNTDPTAGIIQENENLEDVSSNNNISESSSESSGRTISIAIV